MSSPAGVNLRLTARARVAALQAATSGVTAGLSDSTLRESEMLRVREAGPVADLRRRAAALREEIAATERKRRGIDEALSARRLSLQRLEARLVLMEDAVGPGLSRDVP
jgi:hypothetical protein